MTTTPGAVFRIPVLGWTLALIVCLGPLMFMVMQDLSRLREGPFDSAYEVVLLPAVLGIFMAAYSFWAWRLEISPAGLRLYHVNSAMWDDITAARPRRVLFLPYLHLTRRRGMSWWVPLYFVGPEPVAAALARYAPEGHPVRDALHG
jgi:hypothetical protein